MSVRFLTMPIQNHLSLIYEMILLNQKVEHMMVIEQLNLENFNSSKNLFTSHLYIAVHNTWCIKTRKAVSKSFNFNH